MLVQPAPRPTIRTWHHFALPRRHHQSRGSGDSDRCQVQVGDTNWISPIQRQPHVAGFHLSAHPGKTFDRKMEVGREDIGRNVFQIFLSQQSSCLRFTILQHAQARRISLHREPSEHSSLSTPRTRSSSRPFQSATCM